ncbi:MAG: hypothetical protein A4E38_00113 [Methanoregulaceae archaeon PtaB.Bin108]|nr:MAG: hypothetical protein A4E38_00113 [Methanoregulaceae archaeon PtaB.Bin108]
MSTSLIFPGFSPCSFPRRMVRTFWISHFLKYARVRSFKDPGVIFWMLWYSFARFQLSASSIRSIPWNEGASSSISFLYWVSSMDLVISERPMFSIRTYSSRGRSLAFRTLILVQT